MPTSFSILPKPNAIHRLTVVLVGADEHPELLRELSGSLTLHATDREGRALRVSSFSINGYAATVSPDRVIDALASIVSGLSEEARSAFHAIEERSLEISLLYDHLHTVSTVKLERTSVSALSKLDMTLVFVALDQREIRD